jgi:hypothetical protein
VLARHQKPLPASVPDRRKTSHRAILNLRTD